MINLDTPEWKERLAAIEEHAKEVTKQNIEILKVIDKVFGTILIKLREDIHPWGVELSVGSELFNKLRKEKEK